MDSLGDRCKKYESAFERYFIRRVPIIVRVDGKGFSKWTKKCQRPFDQKLIDCIFQSAIEVAMDIPGCVGLYAQSDEATFLILDDGLPTTEYWFGGRQNKIETVIAASMTAYFNKNWVFDNPARIRPNPAIFDARAFQCPRDDVANVFLWRVKDWLRNSLNMFCGSFFSHKQLQGKHNAERHEMLHSIGKNWAKLPDQIKNGSFWNGRVAFDIPDNYESINKFLGL